MRLHITLDDDLVAELDQRVGPRERSRFIAGAVRGVLDDQRRWEMIQSGIGAIPEQGHAWDEAPDRWVREQRRGDAARVG